MVELVFVCCLVTYLVACLLCGCCLVGVGYLLLVCGLVFRLVRLVV